jgi:hypothetical protein
MQSFLRTNYAVRLNKGIERKLIFRALSSLRDEFAIEKYWYLGMGAMWFMDFVLADRQLGIKRMISFELKPEDAKRARTNIPLSVIEVRSGPASTSLNKIPLDKERVVCWLDFDNPVNDEIVDTVNEAAAKMRSGSVLIITVAGTKPRSNSVKPRDVQAREWFGYAVPPDLPAGYFDDDDLRKYPSSLAGLWHETIRETVRNAAGNRKYYPLFGFVYQDGQRMVTVGGMIANDKDTLRVKRSEVNNHSYVGAHITVLEAPLLTAREKAALDKLLPSPRIGERRARRAGLRLSSGALASYAKWFREYPIFAEVDIR